MLIMIFTFFFKIAVDNFVLMINQSMTLDYESTINFNCTLRATDGGETERGVIIIGLVY